MSSPAPPDRPAPATWFLLVSASTSWFAFLFTQIALIPRLKRKADEFGRLLTDLQQTCFKFSNWWSEYWWVFVLPALGLLAVFGAAYAKAPPDHRRTLSRVWLAVFVAPPLVLAAACALVCA